VLFDFSPRKSDVEILAFGFMLMLQSNQKTNEKCFHANKRLILFQLN